jgi:hypothetical protein
VTHRAALDRSAAPSFTEMMATTGAALLKGLRHPTRAELEPT